MKKIIIVIALAILAFSASAQEVNNNWFVGGNGGLNVGYDGEREFWTFSNYGYGASAEAYLGKWLSQRVALRAGYQGLRTSIDRKEHGQSDYGYAHADLMVNLLNFLAGNNADRTVNINPYLHAGYVMCEKNGLGAGAGIQVPVRLGNVVSVVPEVRMNFFKDKIFGMTRDFGAMNGTVSLGLLFDLGRKKKAAPAPVPVPAPVVVPAPAPKPEPQPQPQPQPQPEPEPEVEQVVIEEALSIENIYFPFDVYTITDKDRETLRNAAEAINKMGKEVVIVYGHTDNKGTDEYNKGLSRKRAKTVADYLIQCGVPASKITTEAMSFSQPAATNETVEGRALNRRVEILVK